MLSEKAKGKRRAVEPVEPDPHPDRALVIRFTEGIADLTLSISKQDAVRDVKRMIRAERTELKDRKLRLIHSGRLLTNGTFLLSWLESLEDRQKRATANEGDSNEVSRPSTTWLHCSVGGKIDPEGDSDDGTVQAAQLQPARGFDRLASVGFSEADIANFRRQFHTSSSFMDNEHFDTEEEYDEHARALEEQWIDSMDNAGTASLSQSGGHNPSMMQGLVAGFFFPIIPLFFIRKTHPPVFWEDGTEYEPPDSVIFSRPMQVGLVIGFIANIMFGMWRLFLDAS
ncbi:DUF2407 C-terminal domain-containing protein [Desarmillaria ectypa]|nr:DUF2407 C-terminal domain-containing protein [Desarmillaria ectypa]